MRIRQGPATPERDVDAPVPSPLERIVFSNFSKEQILTERWTAGVRQTAAYLSVDLAMLGRVDMATRIQELLHNPAYIPKGMYDGAANYWPCLNFAWEAAHIQGPNMDDEEALQKRQEDEVLYVEKQCFEAPPNDKHQIEVENDLRRIFHEGIDSFDEDEVVATMTKLSDMCTPGSFQGRAVRARAIDYLMRKGRRQEAENMLGLATQAIQNSAYKLHNEMPKLRYAWRLLVTGVLRDQLGIDNRELEEKGGQAIHTIQQRLRDGPIRPLALEPMEELAGIVEAKFGYKIRNPPVNDEDIAGAEARLDVPLPRDLKAFLHTSNGFSRDEVVVINSISALKWQPPLIPEYQLSLLPGVDAYKGPDIEYVALDRVISLSGYSRLGNEYVYLIEPHFVNEARTRLRDYYENQAQPEMRTIMDKCVKDYFGGWDELQQLDWGITRFRKYDCDFVPGFHIFLEDLAVRPVEL
ncbi:uncharacterized protein N0V89_007888 [Didymosphaeria variabile]|uniref:Knr4/Smi1-like domain-containing protein n=1 Tax=Didymosphaeria variabile TaxID=1932322 RepID=A0A9W9C9X6_9PLEO|nr:uncharacterized protein N0V89_007888 [Didymosphaeria variabile]KAJ4352539.1 hypothetical protein N0V89_007888 [Didymosphaeria variabile]